MSAAHEDSNQRDLARIAGIIVALLGLAHFAFPSRLEPLVAPSFPINTRTHTFINGAAATAVGLGLRSPRTRCAGWLGVFAYLAYIGANRVRHR